MNITDSHRSTCTSTYYNISRYRRYINVTHSGTRFNMVDGCVFENGVYTHPHGLSNRNNDD